MAIKTTAEILSALNERLGEDTSDTTISLVEDITDTLNNYDNNNNIDWKKKYEENDEKWRKKYRDRFFSSESDDDDKEDEPEKEKTLTYDELFKEE